MSRGDYVTLEAQQNQALGYVKVWRNIRAVWGSMLQFHLQRSRIQDISIRCIKKPSRVVILDDVALVSRLIMERPGKKVLYEIRHHASFPYDPRNPPLPQRCLKTEDKVNQAFAEQVADGSSWLTNTLCRT
ncbi:hypothetical protein HID58_049682 [Brassica napus]|uniref:Uncharacterized protein n=1 Tax=Brassica napus TaxID=3708 RepID=A0ABQ8B5N8_BRANA|nr:hypothetical protein HID58_049682 [Brassica napus]